MRRWVAILSLITKLHAQMEEPAPRGTIEEPASSAVEQEDETSTPSQMGIASLSSSQRAVENHWQNWTFAAVLMVTAATGVYLISLHDGKKAH